MAEDLVAETFHRLLQALARRQGPRYHVRAWLYRVLHNLVVDHYRRQAQLALPLLEELPAEGGPEEEAQRRFTQEHVRRALLRLTPDHTSGPPPNTQGLPGNTPGQPGNTPGQPGSTPGHGRP